MRLERAEYEAQLAERRYQEVDPANRLVAGTLERRWNDALVRLEALRAESAACQQQEARVASAEQKAKVMALAQDFPRLWHAPTTAAKDRKRMLRLLIKDITVDKRPGTKQVLLHVHWQGGACTDVPVTLPPNIADRLRYPAEVVDQVRTLARDCTDGQIAAQLNQAGTLSATGKPFNVSMIRWIRYCHQIPKAPLKRPEERTVQQVAERFGVSDSVVYYWIERGVLKARQLKRNTPYWITLDRAKERELEAWVRNSPRISTPDKSANSPVECAL